MVSEDKITISLEVPVVLKDWLRKKAYEENVSMSKFIRKVLETRRNEEEGESNGSNL